MARRFCLLHVSLLAAMAGTTLPALAADAPTSQEWRVCTGDGSSSDLVIKSCSVVIQAGRETKARLAIAHYHRATAYRSKGDLDRAIKDYDQAILLAPTDAAAFNNRGLIFARKGDSDRAIQDYDRAIRFDPT